MTNEDTTVKQPATSSAAAPPAASAPAQLRPAEQPNIDDFLEDMNELAPASSIRVARVLKNGNETSFLFGFAAGAHTMDEVLERLRDEFGGGAFQIQVRENNRMKRKATIMVERPANWVDPTSAKAAAPVAPPAPAAAVSSVDGGLAAVLAQMQSNMQTMMLESAKQQNALLLAIVPKVSGGGGGTNLTEMAAFITAMRPSSDIDPVAQMTKLLQLQKEMRDTEPGEADSLAGVAREVMPGLIQLANSAMAPGEATDATAAPAKPSAAQRQLPAPTKPATPPQPMNMLRLVPENFRPAVASLLGLLPLLLRAAANGKDPADYASMVCAECSDEAALLELVQTPGVVKMMAMGEPKIGPHARWFEALLVTVSEMLKETAPVQTVKAKAGGAKTAGPKKK